MTVLAVISCGLFAAITVVWLVYLREAFGQSPGQGLLVLLVPPYVLHFALVRSLRGRALRIILFGGAALLLAVSLLAAGIGG